MNRRPLAALALSAATLATLATLAVPAGAAAPKTKTPDWVRVTLPCRTGHKAAVIGYSPTHPAWIGYDEGGGGIPNPHAWASYFSNPCKGQWLTFGFWHGDPSEDSNSAVSAGTGTYGRTDPGVTGGQLVDAPYCPDDVGFDVSSIVRKGQTAPC
jgi:hypothetical protein